MSFARASAYRSCIASYVGNLKRIHPAFDLRPNHHASFHIYDYLLLFGPVHSWWTFPFERLIGTLQRLPSNHKTGELESTMLQSYLKGAKLRAWLSRPNCPPAIRECKILLDQAYRSQNNAHEVDADGVISPDGTQSPGTSKMTALPRDLQALIGRRSAVLRAHVKHHDSVGVFYSRSSTHIGNSLVLFYPRGDRSSRPVPGSIKYIYEDEGSILFAVRRQHPLTARASEPADVFAAYPHFPAKLYSAVLEETLECVRISWVAGHYARWALSAETVVVLSLCRD
ncbi:hypothetical protein HYDPIDRAFT_44688 [Hydnomerulius pinastri MD-312]|uniref:Unplaced genomic scaffold scaffold_198, whole genome shotgun sequence n=1 Tax=Hydnomerulius pinastri MD-312 TaxID=994086 RepID=A0A0C9W5P8_9AGAM|nr:hypothetical protein HYDPIDRAFT_44688 [Hydnomerulius pinastri MD-312]